MNTAAIYRTLRRIAKKRDIWLIEEASLPGRIYGLWFIKSEINLEVVALNKTRTDPEERIFTLAHELGHSALHRHQRRPSGETFWDWAATNQEEVISREREADAYAEHLLIRLGYPGARSASRRIVSTA